MATAATERLRNYLEAFHSFGAAQQPAWLRALRERGFARFAEAGFPTPAICAVPGFMGRRSTPAAFPVRPVSSYS